MSYSKSSRRKFLHQFGTASLLAPLGSMNVFSEDNSNLAAREVYHFSQPNENAPVKILQPTLNQIAGFQVIAWRTSLYYVKAEKNNVEAIINSFGPEYTKGTTEGICTVQIQKNWGGTDRSKGINAWDSAKYGGNADSVKLSFGGMVKIPFSTPPHKGNYPANYADFYLRGYDLQTKLSYWLQFAFYDNRGLGGDDFRIDPLTSEQSFEGKFRSQSAYMSLIPSSNSFITTPFSDQRFFGGSISRRQFSAMITQLNNKHKKYLSINPDQHRIFAFGCTPELGLADPGACMSFSLQNMFLRTEY